MREKRSHDRFPIQLEIILLHRGEMLPGRTRDLSLGGMFVYSDVRLRFGAEVDVRLSLPEFRYSGDIPSIVRWSSADGTGLAFRSLRARDVHAFNLLFKAAPEQ